MQMRITWFIFPYQFAIMKRWYFTWLFPHNVSSHAFTYRGGVASLDTATKFFLWSNRAMIRLRPIQQKQNKGLKKALLEDILLQLNITL
jgi:hypothetical protein